MSLQLMRIDTHKVVAAAPTHSPLPGDVRAGSLNARCLLCSGSFTEEFYYKAWAAQRPDLPMVYLPVGWSTYLWSSRLVLAHMPETYVYNAVEKVRNRCSMNSIFKAQMAPSMLT